jgi:uncharacterized protein (TIGR00266 family)
MKNMVQGKVLEFEILEKPTFSYIRIHLKTGQSVQCERGTMIFFDPQLEITTRKASKGIFKSLKRTFAGETFFLNEFYAKDNGYVGLAPPFAGDIMHIPIEEGEIWKLFSGVFVASSKNIETETRWIGLKKAFFSGESAFTLNCKALDGPADVFVGANGAFYEIQLEDNQVFNCDNGHLVAMESSVAMDIKKVGGWKTTLLSGEGVITQLTGPGRVIMQSRNPREFAMWLYKLMPKPRSQSR